MARRKKRPNWPKKLDDSPTPTGFAARESLIQSFLKNLDEGLSPPDAAKAASVPYALILAHTVRDPELLDKINAAADRPVLSSHIVDHIMNATPLDLRDDMVRFAMAAGLAEKVGEIIARAQVWDDESKEFRDNHLNALQRAATIVTKIMPKEQKIEHHGGDLSGVDTETLVEEVLRRNSIDAERRDQAEEAKKIRESGGIRKAE